MTVQDKINGKFYCGRCAFDPQGGDEGSECPCCGNVRQYVAILGVEPEPFEPTPEAEAEPEPPRAHNGNSKDDKRRAPRKANGQATGKFSEGAFARAWAHANDQEKFLFVTGVGWLRYSSGIWIDGAVAARRGMADLIHGTVNQTADAPKYDRAAVIEGALKMAQVQPSEDRTVEVSAFDRDPMSIGLPGGKILEIATAAVRAATPEDRLRRCIAVAPSAEPSRRWADFIHESLTHYAEGERDNVAGWLQEFCGAMLSGNCSDQKSVFVWGQSGTGKSVFVETLRHVMAGYSGVVAGERLTGREGGHRQWVMGLAGRRLVVVSELPERARWNTSDLNSLIEGGPLEANSMRKDSITFNSQASVILVGNHRPRASAASGIWRRLIQVEFRNRPEKPDPKLLDKLKAEAPGVLAWMAEGAARWHARGSLPQVPASIRQAVESYRREADPFAQFLDERTVKAPGEFVSVDHLYDDFRSWWLREVDSDEKTVAKKRGFGTKLNEAGWPESIASNGRRVRPGYRLADAPKATTLPFPRPMDEGAGGRAGTVR